MRALITGAGGQDGIYLSEYLLSIGYEVYGLVRRTGRGSDQMYQIPEGVMVIESDVLDARLPEVDEVYHLAAQSHVGHSFQCPVETLRTNVLGTAEMLEYARWMEAKFYQASTSELFGSTEPPQDEATLMHPRSPYAVSKLAAYWLTINYREAYGVPTYNGILFNHESPLRGADFVTQKIAQGVAAIAADEQSMIRLGNLDARRDWGHARDYVEAMWLMMQHDPGEYVVATGRTHSVRDVLDIAFGHVGIKDWSQFVVQDEAYMRPSDVDHLCGDARKMRALGWEPRIPFEAMIREMVDAALYDKGLEVDKPKLSVVH